MGYILIGADGHKRSFPNHIFFSILRLAANHGWTPQGDIDEETIAFAREEGLGVSWAPLYLCEDGKCIDSAEAAEMATALESILDDIPTHDAREDKLESTPIPGLKALKSGQKVGPIEELSGPRKAHVRSYIAMCRAGGFQIAHLSGDQGIVRFSPESGD